MEKDTLLKLVKIVNEPLVMEALTALVEDRTLYHYKNMTYTDETGWRKSQGAIEELQRLLKLREEVNQKLKDINKNG